MTAGVVAVRPGIAPTGLGHVVAIGHLARVEGRRLVRHPLFLAGCALTVAYFLNTRSEPNAAFQGLTGAGAMGPAMGTMLAANLAALRARTSGAEEVLGVTAVPPVGRTAGLLLALTGPVLATVLLLAGAGVAMGLWWDGAPVATPEGIVDLRPTVTELLQGPAFVGTAGALGVVLARWVPYRLASVVLAITYFFVFIPTYFWGTSSPWRYLIPLADHSNIVGWVQVDPGTGYHIVEGFDVARMGWHIAYLGGLTALLSGLALARHGWHRLPATMVAVASLATVVTAAVQVS